MPDTPQTVTFRLAPELIAGVDELAAYFAYATGGSHTRSDVIRRAIVELLDRHADDVARYQRSREEFLGD